mgnify:FL=1|tara:strand:- start:889 stop:1572 length:684 start_codon:yes stop_codon:yes gene_type:complete
MRKFIPTEEELKNILKMYNEELIGSQTISEKTGISKPTILKILKENGVVMGPSGRRFIGGKKIADKKWRDSNKEYISKKHKKWSEDKQEHLRKYHQKWREKNIDKHREYKRKYEKHRKDTDPSYKLIANFRTAIYQVLKENNVEKNKHYFDILRYTPEELISHLENLFTDGMTWENYGEWHVDHRMPISSFNFESVDDDSFTKCWSLDNLQPMWGVENIVKGNNIIY